VLEVWKVTSIYHPELLHNKTLWRHPLQLKVDVAPKRKYLYKSHVSILKIDRFKWKEWARIKP
jgi:hypothetical protein